MYREGSPEIQHVQKEQRPHHRTLLHMSSKGVQSSVTPCIILADLVQPHNGGDLFSWHGSVDVSQAAYTYA